MFTIRILVPNHLSVGLSLHLMRRCLPVGNWRHQCPLCNPRHQAPGWEKTSLSSKVPAAGQTQSGWLSYTMVMSVPQAVQKCRCPWLVVPGVRQGRWSQECPPGDGGRHSRQLPSHKHYTYWRCLIILYQNHAIAGWWSIFPNNQHPHRWLQPATVLKI